MHVDMLRSTMHGEVIGYLETGLALTHAHMDDQHMMNNVLTCIFVAPEFTNIAKRLQQKLS